MSHGKPGRNRRQSAKVSGPLLSKAETPQAFGTGPCCAIAAGPGRIKCDPGQPDGTTLLCRIAFGLLCCHNLDGSYRGFETLCWESIVTNWLRVSEAARRGRLAQGVSMPARNRARFGSLNLVARTIRSFGVNGPMDWIAAWLRFLVRWLADGSVVGVVESVSPPPRRLGRTVQRVNDSGLGRHFGWITFLPAMDGFGGPPNRLGYSRLGAPGMLPATVWVDRVLQVSSQASRARSCPPAAQRQTG